MRHSLHAHVRYLESTIENLRIRLADTPHTVEEREDLELQLTLAESALEHYRHAYALELSLSGAEPPNQPAGNGDQESRPSDKSRSEKKKDGLVILDPGLIARLARTGRSSRPPSRAPAIQPSRRAASGTR
ncbi:hypothetical protein DYQ86_03905 [Acidobacteria bacterium AB60]|nr:hypothetical protein DYQ86_03905 [Acidobacteria bacterium AB60]